MCAVLLWWFQTTFAFFILQGDQLTFDVYPMAGQVGFQSYDLYPLFSGFLMGVRKFGIFPAALLSLWSFQSSAQSHVGTYLLFGLYLCAQLSFLSFQFFGDNGLPVQEIFVYNVVIGGCLLLSIVLSLFNQIIAEVDHHFQSRVARDPSRHVAKIL